MSLALEAQAGCVDARLVAGKGGVPAIRVANNCDSVIRYVACVSSSENGWSRVRARVSGTLDAGQKEVNRFRVPPGAAITDTGFRYETGGLPPVVVQCS